MNEEILCIGILPMPTMTLQHSHFHINLPSPAIPLDSPFVTVATNVLTESDEERMRNEATCELSYRNGKISKGRRDLCTPSLFDRTCEVILINIFYSIFFHKLPQFDIP